MNFLQTYASKCGTSVEFLLEKRRPESPTTLRQDWAGALEKYREKKALA